MDSGSKEASMKQGQKESTTSDIVLEIRENLWGL